MTTLEPAPRPVAPSAADGPMHEMKFALTPDQADAVELRLREAAGTDAPRAVRVVTLCLDTPDMAVYRRAPGSRRRRYRVRAYGDDGWARLERKRRTGGRSDLRAAQVPRGDLEHMLEADDDGWAGAWFRGKVAARDLRPTCAVAYHRTVYEFAGPLSASAAIDRDLRCWPVSDYRMADEPEGVPMAAPEAMLELRYGASLPTELRRMIAELRLAPCARSKYRLAVEALGLARGGRS